MKKAAESELRTTDFTQRQRDPTLFEYFLERSIPADRDIFTDVILTEDADSVVLLYSTEVVNYVQRKVAFNYNLVIETLSNEALYGDMVGSKLKFYAYNAYQYGFPKGIPYSKAPPEDRIGN